MAYKSSHLFLQLETPDGRKVWLYSTVDNMGAVTGPNYFSDAATQGMSPGDLVIVTTFTTEQSSGMFLGFQSSNFCFVQSVGASGGTAGNQTAVAILPYILIFGG
jgi:hypothetical protein